MVLILYFLTLTLIIIFSVIKVIKEYNLGHILILIGATLMLLIELVSILKDKKLKVQSDKFLVNLFVFIFGCCLLYITFTYIKAGYIIGGLLALFFAVITFDVLKDRIAFSRVKEGMTSNVAKLLSRRDEFTMQLPVGWQTHPHLESEFFEWKNKENNWGRIESFPFELKADETFYKFVERDVKKYLDEVYGNEAKKRGYSQIISKEVKQIRGREAIQVDIDMAESIESYTYIHNAPDEYLLIFFKLLKEHFSNYKSLLQDSIASIMINPRQILRT